MTKAVALLSGGLDSRLAVRVIQEQNIEVLGVNFLTPFFGASPAVHAAANQLGVPLRLLDITAAHWDVVRHPKYGYGKNMNPCIDCHALMVREAGRLMEESGANFIITGEVLGQRPKSQNPQALRTVEKESGYPGLVLRPLSARLLPPTLPEERGQVNRERLLDIAGRSRLRQMELAEKYGITDYPPPAGGCLLTDPGYSQRLRGLLENKPQAEPHEARLLRFGRCFLLSGGAYLAVGRREEENRVIAAEARPADILLTVEDFPGPISLLRLPREVPADIMAGIPALAIRPPEDSPRQGHLIQQAAAITARYSDAKNLPRVKVAFWHPGDNPAHLEVEPDFQSRPV